MTPADLQKLVGGWAAGTLTEAERTALLTAALEDQQLFNMLMAEQPLKEVLDDPASRAELLAALDKSRPRRFGWLFRPWPIAAAGTLAAAAILTIAISQRQSYVAPRQMVAEAPAVQPPLRNEPQPQPQRTPTRRSEAAPQPELKAKLEVAPPPPPPPRPAAPAPLPEQDKVVAKGVIGGVPGGVAGGVIGGAISSAKKAEAPPPPAPRQFTADLPATTSFRGNMVKSAAERADAAAPRQYFTFRILMREEQNEYREVAARTQFATGDAIVISIDALQTGNLRLFEGTTPISENLAVEAGRRYTLPTQGALDPGNRTLTLTFTLPTGEATSASLTLRTR